MAMSEIIWAHLLHISHSQTHGDTHAHVSDAADDASRLFSWNDYKYTQSVTHTERMMVKCNRFFESSQYVLSSSILFFQKCINFDAFTEKNTKQHAFASVCL